MGREILQILKRELGAVEISAGNPRFRDLVRKRCAGAISYDERTELEALSAEVAKPFLWPEGFMMKPIV